MKEEEKAVVIREALQEAEERMKKLLLKKGVLNPEDAIEVSFTIVRRLRVSLQEVPPTNSIPTPASVCVAEWKAMFQPILEKEVPYTNYMHKQDLLASYDIQTIQQALRKLRNKKDQPTKYCQVLTDGINSSQVNGFLTHLNLNLRLRCYHIKSVGVRSRKERKIQYVVLVRPSSEEVVE